MNVATVRPPADGAILLSLRRLLSILKQTFSLLPLSARLRHCLSGSKRLI